MPALVLSSKENAPKVIELHSLESVKRIKADNMMMYASSYRCIQISFDVDGDDDDHDDYDDGDDDGHHNDYYYDCDDGDDDDDGDYHCGDDDGDYHYYYYDHNDYNGGDDDDDDNDDHYDGDDDHDSDYGDNDNDYDYDYEGVILYKLIDLFDQWFYYRLVSCAQTLALRWQFFRRDKLAERKLYH